MFARRKNFNPKRAIASITDAKALGELSELGKKVRYGGNAEHKRNPGDFGLNPPMNPRPDKTLCDGAGILERRAALRLLKEGIIRGLISAQKREGLPQNIWAVTDTGIPLEAQLENAGRAEYHGYPMPEDDKFREVVLKEWRKTCPKTGILP